MLPTAAPGMVGRKDPAVSPVEQELNKGQGSVCMMDLFVLPASARDPPVNKSRAAWPHAHSRRLAPIDIWNPAAGRGSNSQLNKVMYIQMFKRNNNNFEFLKPETIANMHFLT